MAAPCPHFPACGGCVAQDKPDADYRAWKTGIVQGALRQHGLDFKIDDFISVAPHSRRRIVLSFTKDRLGFHGLRSNEIVPIQTCIVGRQELVDVLPALRELAEQLTPKKDEGRIGALISDTGLDIAIEDVKPPSPKARAALAAVAVNSGFARLSVNGETIAQLREPLLKAGRAVYAPPPGAFVQAVFDAEEKIAEKICAALKEHKIKRAVDLFAGCGAFSLRAAETCTVHAVESDEAALTTLQKAARNTQGLKPVTIERRDLFRRPLLPLALKNHDAVILDPPRQGAASQIAELCKGKVKLVVYVSCNPGTFARDAKMLVNAGYGLRNLSLIDQFLWSDHVELIAIFIGPR